LKNSASDGTNSVATGEGGGCEGSIGSDAAGTEDGPAMTSSTEAEEAPAVTSVSTMTSSPAKTTLLDLRGDLREDPGVLMIGLRVYGDMGDFGSLKMIGLKL
jgi:hypothetical protein